MQTTTLPFLAFAALGTISRLNENRKTSPALCNAGLPATAVNIAAQTKYSDPLEEIRISNNGDIEIQDKLWDKVHG